MPTISRGDKVKHRITGFKGIVIARTEWLNGCVRMIVQADALDKDGKPFPAETFDIEELKLVEAGAIKAAVPVDQQPEPALAKTGGPASPSSEAASRRR